MGKISNRLRLIRKKFDESKYYNFNEAIQLFQSFPAVKFIESVDVAVNLGIDAKKSDQNIRGAIVLPHGIGRYIYVAVFTQGSNVKSALSAGADIVGMEDLAEKIKQGNIYFDVVIASPDAMPIVGQLGQILGPKGLMPNPKLGTITLNIAEAVKNAKAGQIRYRNDKNGIVHSTIGRINFCIKNLRENLEALLISLLKKRPVQLKGVYIKKISISTTMGIGISIDLADFRNILK